jgi:hypothetical protein
MTQKYIGTDNRQATTSAAVKDFACKWVIECILKTKAASLNPQVANRGVMATRSVSRTVPRQTDLRNMPHSFPVSLPGSCWEYVSCTCGEGA